MSMRYPNGKLYLFLLRFPFIALVVLLAVAVLVMSLASDSSTPWISESSSDAVPYVVAAAVGGVSGELLGFLWARRRRRRADPATSPRLKKRLTWRYREMSRREKRRIAVVLTISLSLASLPFSLYAILGDPKGEAAVILTIITTSGALGTLLAFVMVLVHVRPSRTVMQIVEDRLKGERAQMAREMDDMRESDARHMEQWKNETIAKLYAMVMDQVERGVITCEKCAEIGAAHFSENDEEPPPDRAEDDNGACQCGGPASIPVLLAWPSNRSRRRAS
ncbi:hypothetical protein PV377_10925 [Streptomyces ipomoeae]|uniref:hypothetical protein n=1 Tax=Streptomyces ipomoeae TaxID=103232 RepID=UPI00299FB0FE|nr:hypothetical protein [Streptomyces ipomoeae]MDX2839484.1 hypothetical protein [Streptomyces ipomoeae]